MSTTAENIPGFNRNWAKKTGLGATLAQLPPKNQIIAEAIIAAQTPLPRDSESTHIKREELLKRAAEFRRKLHLNSSPPHST